MNMTEQDPNIEPEAVATHDVARDLKALETILHKTQHQAGLPVIYEGFLWLVATITAVALSAVIMGLLGGKTGALAFDWIVLGGSAVALTIACVALFRFRRVEDASMTVARDLQQWLPELRNDLTSALQFGRELAAGTEQYSRSLATEHVRVTARKVLGMVGSNGSLAHLLPKRDTMPATLAMGAGMLALFAIVMVWTDELRELGITTSSADEASQIDHRPVVGDLDVFVQRPAYTELPSTMLPFTTGNVSVLVGSEITIRTYPLIAADRYELVLTTEDGTRPIPLTRDLTTQSRRTAQLEANFLATKPATYHFRAVLSDGSVVDDGIERSLQLIPDEPPSITILSHEGEIEVSPDETLTIAFSVQDDFGVESVVRVHGFESDEPQRLAIDQADLTTVPKSMDGEFVLDLGPMNLQPKDVVFFNLEASDNNTLTGPGVGKSQPIVLRVASPEDKHVRVIESEQEVLEALLSVLADFLENPVGERYPDDKGLYRQRVKDIPADERTPRHDAVVKINNELGEVLKTTAEVIERMKQDPLMLERDYSLFNSVYEQLYQLQRDGHEMLLKSQTKSTTGTLTAPDLQRVADFAARTEDSLEKGLLRLQDLLATQKMDAIQATAKDIKELKERLRELLEKYRDSRDPELKEAIKREIQRLRARMRELMERMQSQLQQLPEEHVNLDALRAQELESDTKKLSDNLQSIEEMLDKDDIDGALEELDRMTENLDSLTQEMDEQFEGSQPEGLSELDQELSKLMDSVNDLEIAQRSVEQETSKLQEEVMEEHREKMKSLIQKMSRDILDDVRKQKREVQKMQSGDLPRHEQSEIRDAVKRLDDLEEMLEQNDVEPASGLAKDSVEELRTLQFGMQLMQRYAEKNSPLGKTIKKTMKSLEDNIPRGQSIRKQIDTMMDRAQSEMAAADPQRLKKLQQNQNKVSEQAGKLEQKIDQAAEKFPMLEQQLKPGAAKAKGAMEEAGGSLKSNKVQRGLDGQRQALDELNKLKSSMKQSLRKKNGKKKKMRHDKVAIPEKEGANKKKQFREAIMKNMKDGRLDNYADEIERYYKSLME